MKIDQDYLKGLLEAFEAAPGPVTEIIQLQAAGFDYQKDEDRFLFHLQILNDQGFVRREDGGFSIGASRGADLHLSWAAVPLRLTASGHAFIEALRNKEVWEVIKANFKDATVETLASVSKKLLDAFAAKKLKQVFGDVDLTD